MSSLQSVVPATDPWRQPASRLVVTFASGQERVYYNIIGHQANDWTEKYGGYWQRIGSDSSLMNRLATIGDIVSMQVLPAK